LIRLPRPAVALFAGFVLVFASACSSSSATTAPAGQNGASAAAGATTAAGGSAAANPNDPNSIITQAISSGATVKSFHIKIAVTGTIKAAALKSEAADSGLQITSDVKLDGLAVEGDVDVANHAGHLALTVPALAMLGNIPITGDLILVNNALYYKVSLLGTKYTKTDLGSLTDLSPVAIPTIAAEASPLTGITDEVTQFRNAMQSAGVTATLVGVEQIGGQDANHISFSVPLDKLNADIAAAASSAAPGMKIDSASVDLWLYKSNNQIAQVKIAGASSTLGNIGVTITVTNYDQPVTVTAPAASDIQAAQ